MTKPERQTLDPRFASYLLESMADGVFTLNRSGEITSWNAAMEKISGYSAAEALGRACTLLKFNLCLKKSCPSGIKECGIYEKGAVDAKECALSHKEGHVVPVLKSARLVRDEHSQVIGIVETVTDLTELKKARREIEEISRKLGDVHRLDNIIGKSRAMQDVFAAIRKCHETVHEMGAVRISSTLRFGTRTDRDQGMDDKVRSVEKKLGEAS